MAAPAVYLDECVDEPLIEALRGRGYSLVTAREAGALGLSDEAQLDYATELGMPVLSYNRRHFQRLHRRLTRQGDQHPGIVAIPLPSIVASFGLRCSLSGWASKSGNPGSSPGVSFSTNCCAAIEYPAAASPKRMCPHA